MCVCVFHGTWNCFRIASMTGQVEIRIKNRLLAARHYGCNSDPGFLDTSPGQASSYLIFDRRLHRETGTQRCLTH